MGLNSNSHSLLGDMVPEFSRTADILIALILCLCSSFGIVGNMVSLYHFITTQTNNNNSTFFKNVYAAISLINLLHSASLFPVIDSALTDGEIFSCAD